MSRNDQVIRQWFLLQKLGSGRGATLQELAATLPEDWFRHPRTIRRDLEALDAAHFPLLTERVGGQTRWRLMDGSRHIPMKRELKPNRRSLGCMAVCHILPDSDRCLLF